VGAGLERHDERRAARGIARLLESANFGMGLAGPRVKAFGDRPSPAQDHRSDPRVWMRGPHAPARDPKSTAHGRDLRNVTAILGGSAARPGRHGIDV
jgi:hypothetical protein